MEQLVRTVISKYTDYVAEAQLLKKCQESVEHTDMVVRLNQTERKIAAIEAWLTLLSVDERFVIEKHLIEKLDWPRVTFEFEERWKNTFFRSERALGAYQAKALKKIVTFASKHQGITEKLFLQKE